MRAKTLCLLLPFLVTSAFAMDVSPLVTQSADQFSLGLPNSSVSSAGAAVNHVLRDGNLNADVQMTGIWARYGRLFSAAQDWTQYSHIAVTVKNNGVSTARMRFEYSNSADFTVNSAKAGHRFELSPGQTQTVVMELKAGPNLTHNMLSLPSPLTSPHIRLWSDKDVSRTQIYSWSLYLAENTTANVTISDAMLFKVSQTYTNIFDEFGQRAQGDWNGKVYGTGDLLTQKSTEDTDLALNPGGDPLAVPGNLPTFSATGKWRVEKLPSGKWYFVQPNGKLFWSYGITTVDYSEATPIAGRETMFSVLPSQSGSALEHYSQMQLKSGQVVSGFNFRSQNLAAKYGPSWKTTFVSRSDARIRSWGFNTISAWSNDSLMQTTATPYILHLQTNGFGTRLDTRFYAWRKLPDPFDTTFQTWMQNDFAAKVNLHKNRSNLLGITVDGEQSWRGNSMDAESRYQIAEGAINAPMSQPAKQRFMAILQTKYRTISRFNAAWGTNFASWNQLQASNSVPNMPYSRRSALTDISAFITQYSAAYYSKVRAALQALGYTGLYLGSRDNFYTPEAISGANAYLDAFTVNYYERSELADFSFAGFKRPVVLAEFNYGTCSDGNWWGIVPAMDQTDRGELFKAYIAKAAASPMVVGAHWFQYYDEHASGRFDGENYNTGFLSITDTPYQEMVTASRVNRQAIYTVRGQ
ncbi:MAG: beta-galactosidase [Fimbriimonadaceae bacterium]|nr:beta-galactosidase [Fimbriimonadaceae bacterium]